MDPIRYYDIRYVRGNSTTIVVENGSVESAGSNFFGKALVRVLGEHGWGYYCASPFDPDDQTAKQECINRAARAPKLANVPAEIADVPYGTPRSWTWSAAEQALIPLAAKAAPLLKMAAGA